MSFDVKRNRSLITATSEIKKLTLLVASKYNMSHLELLNSLVGISREYSEFKAEELRIKQNRYIK